MTQWVSEMWSQGFLNKYRSEITFQRKLAAIIISFSNKSPFIVMYRFLEFLENALQESMSQLFFRLNISSSYEFFQLMKNLFTSDPLNWSLLLWLFYELLLLLSRKRYLYWGSVIKPKKKFLLYRLNFEETTSLEIEKGLKLASRKELIKFPWLTSLPLKLRVLLSVCEL